MRVKMRREISKSNALNALEGPAVQCGAVGAVSLVVTVTDRRRGRFGVSGTVSGCNQFPLSFAPFCYIPQNTPLHPLSWGRALSSVRLYPHQRARRNAIRKFHGLCWRAARVTVATPNLRVILRLLLAIFSLDRPLQAAPLRDPPFSPVRLALLLHRSQPCVAASAPCRNGGDCADGLTTRSSSRSCLLERLLSSLARSLCTLQR